MELKKDNWSRVDFEEFDEYVKSLKGDENDCAWEKRIVNTNLECFARTSSKAKDIVKELKKGNYIQFLDGVQIKTHLHSIVCAYLLNQMKQFEIYKKYLDKFVLSIDNWASSDVLKFTKISTEELKAISKEYLVSEKPFIRRTAVNIWFEIIRREGVCDEAFELLDKLKNEKEYYVNMCGAWLLAECMTKNRDKTIRYFENNHTNPFVINKSISKCRDSFRVSQEDKELLNQFKIKTQK